MVLSSAAHKRVVTLPYAFSDLECTELWCYWTVLLHYSSEMTAGCRSREREHERPSSSEERERKLCSERVNPRMRVRDVRCKPPASAPLGEGSFHRSQVSRVLELASDLLVETGFLSSQPSHEPCHRVELVRRGKA